MEQIYIERLRTLYSVMAGIPSLVIEMDDWRFGDYEDDDKKFIKSAAMFVNKENTHFDCGTAACALGWACAYPEFKKQGLKYEGGSPTFPGVQEDCFGFTDGFEVGSKFFGISYVEAYDLFAVVDNDQKDHKKIFLDRLRNLLVEKNIITKKRADELKSKEPLYN